MEDYREFWDESFDRLDEYLHRLQVEVQGQERGHEMEKERTHGR